MRNQIVHRTVLALLLSVAASGQTVSSISPNVASFTVFVGDPITQQFSCVNCGTAPVTWRIGGAPLPAGLAFDANTGVISGTPTTAQSAQFTISVVQGGVVRVTQTYSIFAIVHQLVWITPATLPQATAGTPVKRDLNVNLTSTWSTGQNTLPPGVSLVLPSSRLPATSASLSGTFPAVTAATTYTFQVLASLFFPATTEFFQPETISRTFSITVQPAPAISSTFPNAEVGVSYSRAITVTGGVAPFTYSIVTGANSLPPGLTLNTSTGAISGTPTKTGPYLFTVGALDANGANASARVTLTVVSGPSIATSSLPSGQVGVSYATNLSVTNGVSPYTWSIVQGSLPPGISLNVQSGAITGAPTSAGVASFTARVTDVNGAAAMSTLSILIVGRTITISGTPPATAQAGSAYTGNFTATGGNPPLFWDIASGQLPPGLSLSPAGVLSGELPPSAGGQSFTFTVRVTDTPVTGGAGGVAPAPATATLDFVLQVGSQLTITTTTLPGGGAGAPYSITLDASGGVKPYQWSVVTGSLPAGLTLSAAGTISGTPTAAGTANFTVAVSDNQNQTARKAFSITITALQISGTLPDGVVGDSYTATLTVAGGSPPYTFAVSSGALPAGLALNANTGAITGAPTAAAVYSFVITATDSQRLTASRQFSVTIKALSLDGALPTGVIGAAYSGAVTASGGTAPYTYTVTTGSLPAGLALNATTGAITGTPTAAAASTFTITASDSQTLTISKSFTITVRSGLVLTAALPDGVLQTLYRFVFVSGGTPGYAISVASGSLPDGLGFDLAAGSITGTPTRSGAFRFTLQVSDGSQPSLTASRDYTLTIALPTLPAVTLTPLLDSTPSASQPSFGVSMGSGYPVDLTGTAAISFKPISGPVDPDIKFANGQTTASFTVPAGQTTALSGVTPMAFSAGTTAGTITLTVVLSANGTPVLPNPALTKAIVVPPAAPSISSVRMVTTPNGINVLVSGYSNTREIAGATLTFTAGSGASLTTGAFTVPVQAFQDWYASSNSAAFGGQFLLTVPFNLTAGSASLLTAVEVSLTNSIGRTTVSGGF